MNLNLLNRRKDSMLRMKKGKGLELTITVRRGTIKNWLVREITLFDKMHQHTR